MNIITESRAAANRRREPAGYHGIRHGRAGYGTRRPGGPKAMEKYRRRAGADQSVKRFNSRVPLVPPKPKELERAYWISSFLPAFGV